MITLRWASAVVIASGLYAASTGARDWLLAAVLIVANLAFAFTFREPRPRRPVSRWFEDIPPDHPDALGSLDLRERDPRNP
jgi:hypothetical protein